MSDSHLLGPIGDVLERVRAVDWRGYAEFVFRGYFALFCITWLVIAGVFIAGYAVGPEPIETEPVQPLNLDGEPAEIVADAYEQLEARDHTIEKRILHRQGIHSTADPDGFGHPSGPSVVMGDEQNRYDGGILYQIGVNYTTQRVRFSMYHSIINDGYTAADDLHIEHHYTQRGYWQRGAPGGNWVRVVQGWPDRNVPISPYSDEAIPGRISGTRIGSPEEIGQSQAVLRHENETTMVIELTEGPPVTSLSQSLGMGLYQGSTADAEQLLFVIEKSPSPHLSRVDYIARGNNTEVIVTFSITDVDSAHIEHPPRTPPTRVTEAVARAYLGTERIVDWIR